MSGALSLLVCLLCVPALLGAFADAAGFSVSGTDILDPAGKPFLMRGINLPHAWYKNDYKKAIPYIAKMGFNTVRVVLSDGDVYTKDDPATIKDIIAVCKQNKLVLILEVHDTTGSTDFGLLNNAADFWISIKDIMIGTEDHVILNVANEWYGEYNSQAWANGYLAVIPKLRDAGFKHLIIVDAMGWGQGAASISEKGQAVFKADKLGNLVFSLHMYTVAAGTAEDAKKSLDTARSAGVPVMVGEFSEFQEGGSVAYQTIMDYCNENNVSWLAWSLYGNDDDYLDMAQSPSGPLSSYGRKIIQGKNGIRETALPMSLWINKAETSSDSAMCKRLPRLCRLAKKLIS